MFCIIQNDSGLVPLYRLLSGYDLTIQQVILEAPDVDRYDATLRNLLDRTGVTLSNLLFKLRLTVRNFSVNTTISYSKISLKTSFWQIHVYSI